MPLASLCERVEEEEERRGTNREDEEEGGGEMTRSGRRSNYW